jgi:N-acetylmuramoyl-L-alanine amidase
MLDERISARAARGELRIWPPGTEGPAGGVVFALALGALDPVEEITGVQARLNNIGYHCGRIDGIVGPATRRALRDFQAHQGLDLTGAPDEPTRRRLREMHDGG